MQNWTYDKMGKISSAKYCECVSAEKSSIMVYEEGEVKPILRDSSVRINKESGEMS